MRSLLSRILIVSGIAIFTSVASGDMTPFSFTCITNTSATDAGIGESQLSVQVSDVAGNPQQVLFTFRNEGIAACSITDIYFQDGTLLDMASISNGPGVMFEEGATPKDLPGGKPFAFATTKNFFSLDSAAPVQPKGVNPGEYVGVLFDLKSTLTYANVVDALNLGATSGPIPGSLRIGVHVQGFTSGGSESFINKGVVPVPAAVVLVPFGLGLVGLAKRRFWISSAAAGA